MTTNMDDKELAEELRSFASDLETDGDAHEAAIVRMAAGRLEALQSRASGDQMEVERFEEFWDGWGDEYRGMRQHAAGRWVKYDDHVGALAALPAKQGGHSDEA